ncbi:MAG: hypothetical protein QM523_08435 [Candidatus Pacebacteria bacterium]|nr:hypothetical protein [Candidatus Paceibacterota bacterium]
MKNGKCCMSMEATALTVVVSILFALVVAVFYLTLADKAASLIEFTENLTYIFAFMTIFVVFAMVRRRGASSVVASSEVAAQTKSTAKKVKIKK